MTEDFKRRLQAYERGELEGEELKAFEKELEKLEQFHNLLETDDSEETPSPNDEKHILQKNNDTQRKILRKGKWRARIQTAFSAVALFIILTIVSSMLTALYYEWGSNRGKAYRDVIDYSMTLTNPYGNLGGSGSNVNPYFNMSVTRDLKKKIGDEIITVGEMDVTFIFSLMSVPETTHTGKTTQNQPAFFFPNGDDYSLDSDWERLEKLPEGTVTSAYISFDQLTDTDTAFDYVKDKDLNLLWLAVDTGIERTDEWYDGIIHEPFGFPSTPIWHDDDFILESREESKGFLGGGTVSEGYSSPAYEDGDIDMLHEQFLKTVDFLKKYERKANKLFYGQLKLSERSDYIENNGISHYGIVVTGPTKEILALQDESWVNVIQIDEVEHWNWQTFNE